MPSRQVSVPQPEYVFVIYCMLVHLTLALACFDITKLICRME